MYILFNFLMVAILYAENIENFKCYPNPFSPSKGELQVSYSLKYTTESEITIRIFTLTGELVYEKIYPKNSGNITAGISIGPRSYSIWDGKNTKGRYISDGGYILQFQVVPVEGKMETKYLKILVIKD